MEFEYKGQRFPFDMSSPETAQRWLDAAEALQAVPAAKGNPATYPEQLEIEFQGFSAFFDTVLGEGAAAAMLGGSHSVMECLDIFDALKECAKKQRQEREERYKAYSAARVARA